MSVMEIMDFGAAYKGNFLSSIESLAHALAEKNTETVFVFPARAKSRAWMEEIKNLGHPVYFLPESPLKAVGLLHRILRQHKVRVIHSHFLQSNIYIPLRLSHLFRHIPHIFHAHSLPHFPKTGITATVRKWLLHPDKILCVSDAVQNAYRERGFQNCETIPNGIDLKRLKAHAPFPERKPSALMFGYDFAIKGIDTALKAFSEYDSGHRFTLRICVANHREEAEKSVMDTFGEVPNWLELLPPRDDVGTYYHGASVFLSASRTEGMPYAVLEAAGCGLPLALSNIAPHTELQLPVTEFFDTENPKALFDAVCKALNSEGLQENIDLVKTKYSLESWTNKLCDTLQSYT